MYLIIAIAKLLFYCIVISILVFLWLYFNRRRERRLANGWRIVENKIPIVRELTRISIFFIGAGIGGFLVEEYHLNFSYLFAIGFSILIMTPLEKWIPPNEPDAEITNQQ